MIHYTKQNPRFKCSTAKFTDYYGCKAYTISQNDIEKAVTALIRTYVDVLLDHEEMKLEQFEKSKLTAKTLESKIAAEYKAIGVLEVSVTKIFMSLAHEKISKEDFSRKKDVINNTIARKCYDIEKWSGQLLTLTEGRNAAENAIAELKSFQAFEKLDKEIVYLLIDKILIHDESDIEIVWNGEFSQQRNTYPEKQAPRADKIQTYMKSPNFADWGFSCAFEAISYGGLSS